jgi:PEP-CTERM motif-containing protein
MKKPVVAILLALMIAVLSTSIASATPIYYGPTGSSILINANPDLPTTSGYYIWSRDSERKDWSIRWTGNNGDDPTIEEWYGTIELNPYTVTSGGGPFLKVGWEASTDSLHVTSPLAGFYWTAQSGPGWDGFDFSITGPMLNLIGFNLGGTLFDFNSSDVSYVSVQATGIFIGKNLDLSWNTPKVVVNSYGTTKYSQNFEVPAPVPEPGTMMLLGSGLIGLAGWGRKKFRK